MGRSAANLKPSKISHPNSRKAKQLIRQTHKVAARDKKKLSNFMKFNSHGDKVKWFRDRVIDGDIKECNPSVIGELIETYLSRFNDELELIRSKSYSNNRRHAGREDEIRHMIEDETRQYNGCGIEVPDLLQEEHLEKLREWNGELRFLNNLPLTRFSRSQLSQMSNSVTINLP